MAKVEPLDIRRAFDALCVFAKCTREDLARMAGVHPRTVGRWVRGEVVVDIRKLNELATATGIELTTIVGWMKGRS